MAYYFAVATAEDEYEALNIKKTAQFKQYIISDEGYSCTLEEIDRFTSTYTDEARLRHGLYSDEALILNRYYNSYSIIYLEGVKRRKVQGGLLFEDSRKYIDNPNLVIDYIKQRIEEKNSDFFKKLLTLSEDSLIKNQINQIISSIEFNQLNISSTKSIISEDTISYLIKLLTYDYHTEEEGKIEFSENLNYEKFHKLLSFISEYERELINDKKSQHKRTKKIHQ